MINNPSRKGRLSRVSSFFHGNGDYVSLDKNRGRLFEQNLLRTTNNNRFERSIILFFFLLKEFQVWNIWKSNIIGKSIVGRILKL